MTTTGAGFLLPGVPPPPVVEPGIGPGLVYQPDHRGQAENLLLEQFADSTKLHALVRALVGPLQALEQEALRVQGCFDLNTAEGAQLDVVGGFVGVQRDERRDVAYRAAVIARILGNASDGTRETLYAIARALLGPDLLLLRAKSGFVEDNPAHCDVEVSAAALRFPWDTLSTEPPDVVARELADALFFAISGGVSLTLFYQFTDDAHALVFASGDVEEDSTLQGLSDASEDDATGGMLIGIEERV